MSGDLLPKYIRSTNASITITINFLKFYKRLSGFHFQILIREEVKEKLKWNVDRTSPSNKIRDLMDWTRDIMQDISYQRKILFNPIAILFTKGW